MTGNELLIEMGQQVRSIREARGITITKLAEMAGVSKPTIYRLEAGRVGQFATIAALLAALDYDIQPVRRLA